MNNLWWNFLKYVAVGPWLHLYNRPYIKGEEKIPDTGAALIVTNHLAVLDHFFLPLMVRRRITFLAKAEYFNTPGLVGGFQKFFFSSIGQVPIDRTSASAAQDALDAGIRILEQGHLLGISAEGTRSPDARLYRGKTGAARVALQTGVPIIPGALIDTEKANPIGSWIPRPRRVGVIIGDPIDPKEYSAKYAEEYEAARALTDRMVEEIQKLSGQELVHAYAADVKNALAAGEGYPEGTEPGGRLTTPAPVSKPTRR